MVMDRYARQKKIIGSIGQDKLTKSSVLMIGCGGLGCPISLYLVASGVGHITLIDDDVVSLTNLHRQVLFGEEDIGLKKVDVAKTKLNAINSHVKVTAISRRLMSDNARGIIEGHDLVIIGCDNFDTRFLVSELCHLLSINYINASVLGDEGAIAFYDNDNGCYQCSTGPKEELSIIPTPNDIGVLGAMVGVIGTLTATMAIEILTGNSDEYINKIFTFNSKNLNVKSYFLEKNVNCHLCK